MRIRHLTVLIASLSASACHIGASAAGYTPATQAAGATMVVTTETGRLVGELVEVRDNGIVALLSDGRVALVPWSVTSKATAEGVSGIETSYGQKAPPSAGVKANLTAVSHFPQGMTPDIQARFLAAHNQSSILVIQ